MNIHRKIKIFVPYTRLRGKNLQKKEIKQRGIQGVLNVVLVKQRLNKRIEKYIITRKKTRNKVSDYRMQNYQILHGYYINRI